MDGTEWREEEEETKKYRGISKEIRRNTAYSGCVTTRKTLHGEFEINDLLREKGKFVCKKEDIGLNGKYGTYKKCAKICDTDLCNA